MLWKQIIADFFQLGVLRIIARVLMGFRALYIAVSLKPHGLGEYTVWLLFVFYFSMLDFGVLNSLERDLPHYRGLDDQPGIKKTADIGWSTYFILCFLASILLMVVTGIVFKDFMLSLLLAAYLLSDKIYRAYYTNTNIHFKYRTVGIAQVLLGSSSLLFIWLLLPRLGTYGVLLGLIIATVITSFFFSKTSSRLHFDWTFHKDSFIRCVKDAIPLAVMIYTIEFFHMVALTILAFRCDKMTLGYIAFSFRIFQVCLAVFPSLIQDVMRARLYYTVAQTNSAKQQFQQFIYSMTTYGLVVSAFWLAVYWGAPWAINRFSHMYTPSVGMLQWLTAALLPIGIVKIFSDYLCSRVHQKTTTVIVLWGMAIALQSLLLWIVPVHQQEYFNLVSIGYFLSTLIIYFSIVGLTFSLGETWVQGLLRSLQLLAPLVLVSVSVVFVTFAWHKGPTSNFKENILPGLLSTLPLLFLSLNHAKTYFSEQKAKMV